MMRLEIDDLQRAYKWLSALYNDVDYFADESGIYRIGEIEGVRVIIEIKGDVEKIEEVR